jgi:hypothetical protein
MNISQGELEIIKQSIKTAKDKLFYAPDGTVKSFRNRAEILAIQALDNALFRIEQAEQTQ